MKSYREKYRKMSIPAKASLWFVVCNVLQKGVSFLTMPIFTRVMSTEEYGIYTVYNSWYSILSVFMTLNLFYGVYNNGMTRFVEKRNEMTSSMLGLCTCITSIMFIIYCIFDDYFCTSLGLSKKLIIMMFIHFFSYPAMEFWLVQKRYEYKYKSVVFVTILVTVLSQFWGIVAVLKMGGKAEARIATFVMVNAIIGVVLYIYIMVRGKCFYSGFFWKYALNFNLPLIPHYLSSSILNQADRIMICNMIGNDKAAIYSVAYSVGMLMNIVNSAITNAFTPFTYQCMKKRNYVELRKTTNSLVLVMCAFCCIVAILGPEIIKVIASEEYHEAIWVIPPIVGAIYFIFLYPFFSNIEFYFEKTKFIMVASCVSAGMNIGLNYVFIPYFGYIAAGYTTLLCYIIYAYAHYMFCIKILNKNNIEKIYDEKYIGIVSCFLCVFCIVITFTYNNICLRYSFIVMIILLMIIYRKKFFEGLFPIVNQMN